MKCPKCNGKLKVVDNVMKNDENLRRRMCVDCGHTIYTVEFEVEDTPEFEIDWWNNHRKSEYKYVKKGRN